MYKKIFEDAVMFFVVIDPVGTIPLFLSATKRLDASQRRRVALRSVIYAFFILAAFVVGGQILLDSMHINLHSFEIAGGLILFLVGFKMVFEEGHFSAHSDGESGHDVAVFPIAVPWLAGPSAIVSAVLLTDNDKFTVEQQVMTTVVMLGILAVTYVLFLLSGFIFKLIGETGANVISRVMGIILTALSVELVTSGISAMFGMVRV